MISLYKSLKGRLFGVKAINIEGVGLNRLPCLKVSEQLDRVLQGCRGLG